MADLFSVAEEIRRCTKCPLWKTRTLAVPGDGPANASMMFIGEAPGLQEDRQGLPFIGRSGKFLTKMMQQVGILRSEVFVCGACKCRPPKNRVPTSIELSTCVDTWTRLQVSLIKPKIIVLLGGTAAKGFLGLSNVKKLHGTVIEREGRKYFVTYHPSAAMRFPAIRSSFEKDFLELEKIVKNILKNK